MMTTTQKKPATKTPARRAVHVLYDRDCCETTFEDGSRHPKAEDHDGPVMLVKHYGDGELLSEQLLHIEAARKLYAKMVAAGWVKPY